MGELHGMWILSQCSCLKKQPSWAVVGCHGLMGRFSFYSELIPAPSGRWNKGFRFTRWESQTQWDHGASPSSPSFAEVPGGMETRLTDLWFSRSALPSLFWDSQGWRQWDGVGMGSSIVDQVHSRRLHGLNQSTAGFKSTCWAHTYAFFEKKKKKVFLPKSIAFKPKFFKSRRRELNTSLNLSTKSADVSLEKCPWF